MELVERSGRGQRVLALLNPFAMLHNLWRNRHLAQQLARRDIIGRYRSSWLGMLWAVMMPLATLAIYTFVFSTVLESRWTKDPNEPASFFAVTMFCGMLVFAVFSEVVNRAPTLVAENPSYVKKVVFPLEMLMISTLLVALFNLLIGIGVWLVFWFVVMQAPPHETLALLPVVILPVCLTALGLAWLLGSLGVFMRDVGYVVAIATQLLFFATPIFYRLDKVHEPFLTIISFNPMTGAVLDARRVMMEGLPPDWTRWGIAMAGSAVLALLGYAFFMKSKRAFGDVL